MAEYEADKKSWHQLQGKNSPWFYEGDLARAKRRAELERTIQANRPKAGTIEREGDPLAAALAHYLHAAGWAIEQADLAKWLHLMPVLLLEFGSAFGLVVAGVGHGRSDRARAGWWQQMRERRQARRERLGFASVASVAAQPTVATVAAKPTVATKPATVATVAKPTVATPSKPATERDSVATSRRQPKPAAPRAPRGRADDGQLVIEAIRSAGRPLSNDELAAAMRVHRSEASKRRAMVAHLLTEHRQGKLKLSSLRTAHELPATVTALLVRARAATETGN